MRFDQIYHSWRNRSRPFAGLARGLAAYGSAELANRAIRLCATMVIARRLAPDIAGQAALVLTLFELIRVLTRTGMGQKIISCSAQDLDATCNTAARLFWCWFALLVLVQCAIALALALLSGNHQAGAMLAVLSLVYLWMPGGLVQCNLAMRAGLTGKLARTAATQAIADHLLTMVLLLLWASPWSVVLPKLLTAPIWLVMTRHAYPWQRTGSAASVPVRQIARFGAPVMAAEIMNALRSQGDNLIVATVMGTSALGTYYFVFNAGVGIVTSLVTAFGTIAFPMLCAAGDTVRRHVALRRIGLAGLAVFAPLVALQSLSASWYVPLLFGDRWASASGLVAILSLTGLSLLATTLTTCWLRADGKPGTDALNSMISCIATLGGLYLGTLSGSLQSAAIGLVAGQALAAALYAVRILLPALRHPISTPLLKEQVA